MKAFVVYAMKALVGLWPHVVGFLIGWRLGGWTPSRPTARREWLQGGTLHEGTVADWKAGSAENKLATAGDWLTATDWKGHLTDSADFDRMKAKAQMLADAVDEVVQESPDTMKANEIAAALITMSDEFGP